MHPTISQERNPGDSPEWSANPNIARQAPHDAARLAPTRFGGQFGSKRIRTSACNRSFNSSSRNSPSSRVRGRSRSMCASRGRSTIIQHKTGRPVQFEIMEHKRRHKSDWSGCCARCCRPRNDAGRSTGSPRVLHGWIEGAGMDSSACLGFCAASIAAANSMCTTAASSVAITAMARA